MYQAANKNNGYILLEQMKECNKDPFITSITKAETNRDILECQTHQEREITTIICSEREGESFVLGLQSSDTSLSQGEKGCHYLTA